MAEKIQEKDSIFEKIVKGFALYKTSKGVIGFARGPLLLSGIAYFFYRKYRNNRGLHPGVS